jgi:hypothetical protein
MPEANPKYKSKLLEQAHKHTFSNKEEVLNSELCGCFYCCTIYPVSEIENDCIISETNGNATIWCPKCGVDSVIGSASELPIAEKSFLIALNELYFRGMIHDD